MTIYEATKHLADIINKHDQQTYYEKINDGRLFKLFLQIDMSKLTSAFKIKNIVDEFKKFISSSNDITKILFNQDYNIMQSLIDKYEVINNNKYCYIVFPYITIDWDNYIRLINMFKSNKHPIIISSTYYLPYLNAISSIDLLTNMALFIIHAIPREHLHIKLTKPRNPYVY